MRGSVDRVLSDGIVIIGAARVSVKPGGAYARQCR